ncbi:MAG: glycosyltransferase family 39 protein, partial [Bryobacterales bacterium]|nr:glycosyltransferase family 39 protein [Bryobacterales bacterium]
MHRDMGGGRAAVGIWLAVLAFHTVGLFSYPRVEADEGGWPLSVRAWVEAGTQGPDYYMAPAYHWLLGAPLALFGARHQVARPASVAAGLAALWLFHRLARRLAGAETAAWALWLAGSSYGVLLLHRRALMEPWQVLLMMALTLTVVERPGGSWGWRLLAVALTALLLLTKASAVFLLPALVLAAAAGDRQGWRQGW